MRSLVRKVDFLNRGSPDFVHDVIETLTFEVYLAGDVIIKAGRQGSAMYFIEHGSVDIEVGGRSLGTLQDGDHFGGEAEGGGNGRTGGVTGRGRDRDKGDRDGDRDGNMDGGRGKGRDRDSDRDMGTEGTGTGTGRGSGQGRGRVRRGSHRPGRERERGEQGRKVYCEARE